MMTRKAFKTPHPSAQDILENLHNISSSTLEELYFAIHITLLERETEIEQYDQLGLDDDDRHED